MDDRPIMRVAVDDMPSMGEITLTFVSGVLFLVVVAFAVLRGSRAFDCGASDLPSLNPADVRLEIRRVQEAVDRSRFGDRLVVTRVSGHRIEVVDRSAIAGSRFERFGEAARIDVDGPSFLRNVWREVFARDHPDDPDPIVTVYFASGSGRAVVESDPRCIDV